MDKDLRQEAEAIVRLLPGEWQDDTKDSMWAIFYKREDDRKLMFHVHPSNSDRLVIRGCLDNGLNKYVNYISASERGTREITVSRTKTALRISSEIVKRLFPSYEKVLIECQWRKRQDEDHQAHQRAKIKELCEALGGDARQLNENTPFDMVAYEPHYLRARCYDEEVNIENLRLPFDKAIEVFKLLNPQED